MWSRFRETYCLSYKWPSSISCMFNVTNGESTSSNCTASVETNCPIFNLPLDCSSDGSSSLCNIDFSALNLSTTVKHHRDNNKHVGLSSYPVHMKYIIVSLWDSSILWRQLWWMVLRDMILCDLLEIYWHFSVIFSVLKMCAACSSEMLSDIYQTVLVTSGNTAFFSISLVANSVIWIFLVSFSFVL